MKEVLAGRRILLIGMAAGFQNLIGRELERQGINAQLETVFDLEAARAKLQGSQPPHILVMNPKGLPGEKNQLASSEWLRWASEERLPIVVTCTGDAPSQTAQALKLPYVNMMDSDIHRYAHNLIEAMGDVALERHVPLKHLPSAPRLER